MRILWYDKLYVGDKAGKKRKKLLWKVQHCAGLPGVYLLTMPSNEENVLDIIHAVYLKQPVYKRRELKIVGIAVSYAEALQVLEQIAGDVYRETEGLDIRSYLNKEHKFKKWRV